MSNGYDLQDWTLRKNLMRKRRIDEAPWHGTTMQIGHTTADGSQAYTHTVPQFGLGVFLMSEPGECKASVLSALAAGYTHIDTARAYANEH